MVCDHGDGARGVSIAILLVAMAAVVLGMT
jgi:hypothetical protein